MVASMPQAAIDIAPQPTPVDRVSANRGRSHGVVRFLVDDNSRFITGSTYDVNGGMYMCMIGAVPLEEFSLVSISPVPIRHRSTRRCAP